MNVGGLCTLRLASEGVRSTFEGGLNVVRIFMNFTPTTCYCEVHATYKLV